jgi:hypothetical protein
MSDDLLLSHALRVSMQQDCPVCGAKPLKRCVKITRAPNKWPTFKNLSKSIKEIDK